MTDQDKEILMAAQQQERRAAGYSSADEIAKPGLPQMMSTRSAKKM